MNKPTVAEKLQTPWNIAKREQEPKRFLPYSRHIDDHVIALDDGSLLTMFRLDGMAFETADRSDLNSWHENLNSILRNSADERVAWWTHTVRRRTDTYPDGAFRSEFARDLNETYRGRVTSERMFVNELYLSIVMRPAVGAADKLAVAFKNLVSKQARVDALAKVDEEDLQRFNERASETAKLLGRLSPKRLGLYEFDDLLFSEPLEVLELIMMGAYRRIPLVRGHLGSALYGERLIFGREAVEIRAHDRSRFLGLFGIREYPSRTRPGMLDSLLNADFEFVMTHSFAFLGKNDGMTRLIRKRRQLGSTDDEAVSQAEALYDAANDLADNHFVMGEHHFSIAVFGDTVRQLNDNVSSARAALSDAAMVSARETSANEAAFWSQLPGNFTWRARPSVITSRNFAAMSPFHTFPAGRPDSNHWGSAVALLQTTALSPYYFNFHVADIGHTAIFGPTGSGKTVVQNFFMAMLEKSGARQIFIDKDRGAEIYVRASGGTYLSLQNGLPTGFAPLKAFDYTPENVSFLSGFIRQLVRREDTHLTVAEERLIHEGLVALGRLPAHQRSIRALREVLGFKDAEGIGARLERWAEGGPLGWVFDNEADALWLEARFLGFDMTDFLDNEEVRTPVMMYMFQRFEELLDRKERLVIDIDEFWKALGDSQFTRYIEDALLTYRKRNAFLIFGTQNPDHALRSPIASSIVGQVATLIIMPNPKASEESYRVGLGLTAKEFNLIRRELVPESRQFLIKQGHDSIVVKLDLDGLDDALAILSGRSSTVGLLDELRAELGDDPKAWLPEFHRRRKWLK